MFSYLLFLMGQYRPLFVYFRLFHMGLEPGAAVWKPQTNPLSYGGTPSHPLLAIIKSNSFATTNTDWKSSLIFYSQILNILFLFRAPPDHQSIRVERPLERVRHQLLVDQGRSGFERSFGSGNW